MTRLIFLAMLFCMSARAGYELFSFSGVNLAGKKVSEENLNARAAVLIVTFPRVKIDETIEWMKLLEKNVKKSVQVVNLVVGEPKLRLALQGRVPKKYWAETWVVDRSLLARIETPESLVKPYLLIVDATGDIIDSVQGPANQENLDKVLAELQGTVVIR
jgi:hypothetical protein